MQWKKLALLFGVLSTSIGCDQVTKVAARQHLEGHGPISYLGDLFVLRYAENHGAFLSLGASLPDAARTAIFVGLVSVGLLAFCYWLYRNRAQLSYMGLMASAMILGGGVGNLIDRVVFDGRVTDFMILGVGSLRTGIFNVADVCIMVGLGLMLLSPEMRGLGDEPDKPTTEESAA